MVVESKNNYSWTGVVYMKGPGTLRERENSLLVMLSEWHQSSGRFWNVCFTDYCFRTIKLRLWLLRRLESVAKIVLFQVRVYSTASLISSWHFAGPIHGFRRHVSFPVASPTVHEHYLLKDLNRFVLTLAEELVIEEAKIADVDDVFSSLKSEMLMDAEKLSLLYSYVEKMKKHINDFENRLTCDINFYHEYIGIARVKNDR